MNVELRFVPYGTRFSQEPSTARGSQSHNNSDNLLHRNEIAVDVGGTCFAWAKPQSDCEQLPVFDHHFPRVSECAVDNADSKLTIYDNYPAAACAVLHQIEDIKKLINQSRRAGDKDFWIVTHDNPDLDAAIASYLVACAVKGHLETFPAEDHGLDPKGWRKTKNGRRINWFLPAFTESPEKGWPLLLAAYAACQDQCKSTKAPKASALHAVFYAAMKRGRIGGDLRPLKAKELLEFFDDVRLRIVKEGTNPLFDAVFPRGHHKYELELDLLERAELAYQRDLSRARIARVRLPEEEFTNWFQLASNTKHFIQEGGQITVNPSVEKIGVAKYCEADGIYLRDPACLLFKEFARGDTEHSPSGLGFLFTGIAYSGRKSENPCNQSEYFFSLDLERAGHCHLYPVWSRLEADDELHYRNDWFKAKRSTRKLRTDFAGRIDYPDPWYDGNAFRGTIVVSAVLGTCMPGGTKPDLTDDAVAEIVRDVLEEGFFAAKSVEVWDFPTEGLENWRLNSKLRAFDQSKKQLAENKNDMRPVPRKHLRFAQRKLASGLNVIDTTLARQIGSQLWLLLSSSDNKALPEDFNENHLVVDGQMVAVWNRDGIALAYNESNLHDAEEICQTISEIACVQAHAVAGDSNC
jgi:hypothetical protein